MTREVQAVASIVGRVMDGRGSCEAQHIQDCESVRDRGCGGPKPRGPMAANLSATQFFSRCTRWVHSDPP